MTKPDVPLLITSAIRPASARLVKLSSPQDRLRFTAEGVENWLRMVPDMKIVICDGSDYDLSDFSQLRSPAASIEVLSFKNDASTTAALGKGYGEGEIIAYALEHSETLASHEGFMTCTSKYWVSNFSEVAINYQPNQFHIRRKHNGLDQLLPHWVNTRFFTVAKDFHRRYLWNAYQEVEFDQGRYIEHVYAERLLALGSTHEYEFPVKPKVFGVSGTSGVRRGCLADVHRPPPLRSVGNR